MRKKLSLFLLALITSVGTMFASTKIGDLYYNLDATNQTAVVTYKNYTNNMYNEGWGITTANIPASVTYNKITYSVTRIGEWAFQNCSGLTSVTIPNSVTSIGNYAFRDCRGLTSITIPNSVTSIGQYAFRDCRGLTTVTIPNSVTSIGQYAFRGCKGLTSIEIPNSVTSIGEGAFNGCSGLTSVAINSNEIVSKESFIGDIFGSQVTEYIIGEEVTSIGYAAFYGCSGLTSIEIPNSVTSIGSYAFNGCSGLTTVTIPNSVTSIGGSVFSGCSSLTSPIYNAHIFAYMPKNYSGAYSIPDGIVTIAGSVFYGCTGLTSVTIPNSVTSIGSSAFNECSGLTSINVASDNSNYCSVDGVLFNKDKTTLIQYPGGKQGAYTISNSVTSIGNSAFSGCSGLTSIEVPNSVTSIAGSAFSGCSGLTSIEIPNSVTSIGMYAFSGCSHLSTVTIKADSILSKNYSYASNLSDIFGGQVIEYILGDSITSIGAYAFYDCTNVESIDIPESVTNIGTKAFYRVKNINYSGTATGAPWGALSMNNSPFVYSTTEIDSITSRLASGYTPDVYYHFSGVISSIKEVSTDYGNATFYITDGVTTFYCYRIYDLYSTRFTSSGQLSVGDSVVISSKVQNYGGTTPEAVQGRLVYHSANPLFTPDSVIYYGIRRGYSDQLKLYTAIDTDTLNIPESVTYNENTYTVTEMASGAIYNHQNLKCVVLPRTLQLMPRAFELCDSIETIYYNAENLTKPTTIPFVDSKLSLKNVYIGEDVKTIPEGIFNNLENISTVHWDATNCEDMQYSPFYYSRTKIQEFGIANNIEHIPANMCWGMPNITEVTIPNTTTYIGKDAFHNCTGLATLYLGENISTYGDSAFANCPNLTSIYNYRERPAKLGKGTFDGVDYFNCTLYVLAGSVNMYKSTGSDWKDFYFVEPIGATSTTTDEVVVTPHDNTADIVWPTISGAASYELEIKDLDGNLICTLIFNANGQLTSLAFHAPARNNAPQQAQTAGFQFTITGLEIATRYTYTMQVKDASSQVIAEYSGTFGTTGAPEIPTGINNISTTNVSQKIMSNGQIFILRGNKTYTFQGQVVK